MKPQEAYEMGRTLYKRNEFEAALPLFRRALSSGSPNARMYAARCLRELGRLGEAYREFHLAAKDANQMAQTDARYAKTRDVASAELFDLEPRVGKLVIAIPEGVGAANVTLDGKTLAAETVAAPIPLTPGSYTLHATAADGSSFDGKVDVHPGKTKTLPIFVATEGAGEQDDDDDDRGLGTWHRPLFWASAGTAAAGLVVGGIFGAVALSKKGTVSDNCVELACNTEGKDAAESGNAFGNVSTAGFVIAGVGAIAATVLLIAAPEEDPVFGWWSPGHPLQLRW
jgi:hypothetical protein